VWWDFTLFTDFTQEFTQRNDWQFNNLCSMSEKSEIQLLLLAARKNKNAGIYILSDREKWQRAFTLFTCEQQSLVITGFPQGEILRDMDEKGECLDRKDATMNLVDLLRRYAGTSLQPTGGMHTPAQTSAQLLLKPAQAVQPDKAELPTHNHAQQFQMPKALSTATIHRAPIGHRAEKSVILRQPIKQSLELPPVKVNWQEQLAGWPQKWRDLWEERASIMEYEGNLARDDAERHAFELLRDALSQP
jgi:hypothetical protein